MATSTRLFALALLLLLLFVYNAQAGKNCKNGSCVPNHSCPKSKRAIGNCDAAGMVCCKLDVPEVAISTPLEGVLQEENKTSVEKVNKNKKVNKEEGGKKPIQDTLPVVRQIVQQSPPLARQPVRQPALVAGQPVRQPDPPVQKFPLRSQRKHQQDHRRPIQDVVKRLLENKARKTIGRTQEKSKNNKRQRNAKNNSKNKMIKQH